MRTVASWFRMVMPPWWAWLASLAALAFMIGVERLDPSSAGMFLMVIGFVSAAYGVYRAMFFHPATQSDYHAWLRSTPWRHPMPLPVGPVHMVMQDVLVIGMLCAIAFAYCMLIPDPASQRFPRAHSLLQWEAVKAYVIQVYCIALPFLGFYLICIALTISSTGQTTFGYLIAIGLGLVVRVIQTPWSTVAALLITYAVAYVGIQRSLAAFPWVDWDQPLTRSRVAANNRQHPAVGWPYKQLSPSRRFSLGKYRWISLIAGWWSYAVLSHFSFVWEMEESPEIQQRLWIIYRGLVFVLAGGRLFAYCFGHWPPISVLGRIVTGRLLIPGFDQVFVAPLVAIVVGVSFEVVFRYFGVSPPIAIPIATIVILWLIVSLGPSFDTWHFTGEHRLMRWGA